MSPEVNAIVLERIEISPGLIILRIVPDGWELKEFDAGQLAVLALPGQAQRCDSAMPQESEPDPTRISIRASSSVEKKYVELYLSLVPSGTLTPRLSGLHPDSRVWLGGKMSGRFTLGDVPTSNQLVMVGTGMGFAPSMSMLHTQCMCGERRKTLLGRGLSQ